MTYVDVRKAYVNGMPTRHIFTMCPKELGLAPNLLGKLVRCACGCRDAGHIWEECYRSALEGMGFFSDGEASPYCFYHAVKDACVVKHGDDLTTLGTHAGVDVYEAEFATSFELKIRGRIGGAVQGQMKSGC